MKTLEENITKTNSEMSENKKVEILAWINLNWDEFDTKEEMAKYLEEAYVFGELGTDEHRLIEEYMDLINQVYLQKNPPIIEEIVVEEPALETNV